MKVLFKSNGQWDLAPLEKMAHRFKDEPSGKQWLVDNQLSTLHGEKAAHTSEIKDKEGNLLYHHVLTNPHDKDFVRHMISRYKDPHEGNAIAVASGRMQPEGIAFPTSKGQHKAKMPAYALGGVNVSSDEQRKGYGSQLFHNLAHYHGAVIGDSGYSPSGDKLMSSAAKHPAYNFISDTNQSQLEAKENPTRHMFYVKNKKNIGKIPKTTI